MYTRPIHSLRVVYPDIIFLNGLLLSMQFEIPFTDIFFVVKINICINWFTVQVPS